MHEAIGQAAVLLWRSMEKQGGDAELSYGLTGKLYLSQSGWLLLHVPNALRLGAFQALNEHGVELPPGHDGAPSQCHISVMTPAELATIPGGADAVKERGKEYSFNLGPVRTVDPDGWDEMSRVWFFSVTSSDLQKLRKSYGLPPLPKYPFHATIAVRRKKVLHENEISKAAGLYDISRALQKRAAGMIFPKPATVPGETPQPVKPPKPNPPPQFPKSAPSGSQTALAGGGALFPWFPKLFNKAAGALR